MNYSLTVGSILLLLVCISACSNSDERNTTHSFRIYDEEGVTIAETTGGPKYQDPLFTFEEVLVLQEDPENEDSMLYRVGMFLRGDDGRYYVADWGAHRIERIGGLLPAPHSQAAPG